MQTKSRFIASVVKTSRDAQIEMPWARGTRRAAMIARRKGLAPGRRTA